jgi:hypothetical protein
MHRIKAVSRKILDEKLEDSSLSAVGVEDMHAKRDIMSLLVKARKAEEEADAARRTGLASAQDKQIPRGVETQRQSYRMSDDMIMNQVVRSRSS